MLSYRLMYVCRYVYVIDDVMLSEGEEKDEG